jgi:GntR family transcriptional regulator/MocR family aminotransferase
MKSVDHFGVLDRRARVPLPAQLARQLTARIRAGGLGPGDRLPSTRALARQLGVHRNTVVAAFDELVAEGWVEARRGSGTFVDRALPPELGPPVTGRRGPTLRLIARRPDGDDGDDGDGDDLGVFAGARDRRDRAASAIALDLALPDPALLDLATWTRAYRRAARRRARELADYGDGRGHLRLRRALAGFLRRTRGIAVEPDEILVTRGSQMGMWLAGAALLVPGERVAVEVPGYRPAWRAFRALGARVVGVPVDAAGLRVERLARTAARAVYLTPHHQYPTTVTLSAARRLAVYAWAAAHRAAIIEDDYDGELHHDGPPVAPLAADDPAGRVVHVGSLSKLLAPGLRIGYVVAAAPVIERLALLRRTLDRGGDLLTELACAELVEDGELERHARRARRVYCARRDALAAALRESLGELVGVDVPSGGMALWLRLPPGFDPDRAAAACLAAGVRVGAARRYALGRPACGMRLCYGRLAPPALAEAARRIGSALRRAR